MKRFIYVCFCKQYNETYDDPVVIDETTIGHAQLNIKIRIREEMTFEEQTVLKLVNINIATSKFIFQVVSHVSG